MNFIKPSTDLVLQKIKLFTVLMIGLGIIIFAFVVQVIVSNNNTVGFVPGNDLNFNEAIALGVVPDRHLVLSPFNSNFRYHWLSNSWLGVTIRSLKLAPFVGSNILAPFVTLTSTVCLVFSAFKKWRGSGFMVPIITALLIVAGCSVSDQLVFTNDGATSNQFGTLWLILAGYFLFSFLNETYKYSVVAVGSFLLGFLVMGAKGPLAIVLISAASAHALYSIYKRQLVLRSIFCSFGVFAGSTLAYLILVSGSSQQGTLRFVNPTKSSTTIIFLILFLMTTRMPLIYATSLRPADLSNRFLALGASFAMILNYLFIAEPKITYFLTGPIVLSCFFAGLSTDLTIKTQRYFYKIIMCFSALIFLISVVFHGRRIYSSVIPPRYPGELKVDYEAVLLNVQNILVLTSIALLLFGMVIRKLTSNHIRVSIISFMLATTFGTFMADANSVELRQLAIRSNGLDGGPDDSQLVAKAIIKSAIWIRNNSQDNQIIATNYASNGTSSVAYLVSVATQRSVLIEPLDYVSADPLTYISGDSIINNFATNDKLRSDFSKQPNGSTAKALTEVGVDYFLFETTDAQITSSDLCAKNEVWRCDYKNKYSVVIKFLDQN